MRMIMLFFVITVVLGSCGQRTIEEPTFCPAVYDPVCASNGITYSNSCEAEKAGITDYTAGECNDDMVVPSPIEACPAVYNPVCGSNGITYGNSCEAERAGITDYAMGKCFDEGVSANQTDEECPTFYSPVCGANNITYANSCEAERAGIIDYAAGRCASILGVPVEVSCPSYTEPVCGEDANSVRTYDNICLLHADGAVFLYEGVCDLPSGPVNEYYDDIDYSIDVDYYLGYWQYEAYVEKPSPCHSIQVSRTLSSGLRPEIAMVHIRILEPSDDNCGATTRIETVRGVVEAELDTTLKIYLEGDIIFESWQ